MMVLLFIHSIESCEIRRICHLLHNCRKNNTAAQRFYCYQCLAPGRSSNSDDNQFHIIPLAGRFLPTKQTDVSFAWVPTLGEIAFGNRKGMSFRNGGFDISVEKIQDA